MEYQKGAYPQYALLLDQVHTVMLCTIRTIKKKTTSNQNIQ